MTTSVPKSRMPVVFIPHGGGPWPWVPRMRQGHGNLDDYLSQITEVPPTKPKAILVISAHWEQQVPTVMAAPTPPMLYDYSGFPAETYKLQWPAPGSPELAAEIMSRLSRAQIQAATDTTRGFDHGTFVPLSLGYPKPDIPCLQLSLIAGLDPAQHFQLGRALAPLRDEGVFIIGSGMSYHNLPGLMGRTSGGTSEVIANSKAFDGWLAESVAANASERERRLIEWEKAPAARACHPREEHLIPLHVCAGAAEGDAGTVPYSGVVMGAQVSAAQFG